MPRTPDDQILDSIRLFRETLVETKRLYIESGQLIRGSYGWLGADQDGSASSVADQMDDLHQGFVMKVFAAVVPDTSVRSLQQRQLGRVLLEHIWGTSVMGSQLHEAVAWLGEASKEFQWSDLVRPFAEIPAIRDRFGELETLAMRMAKLLASVDGDTSATEDLALQAMQQQFDRLRGRAPEHLANSHDTANARDALSWLRKEADRLRAGVQGPDKHVPTPTPRPSGAKESPAAATTDLDAKNPAADQPAADQPVDQRSAEQRLADAKAKLAQLVGLDGVKDQIETLSNFLKMEQLRQREGLPTTRPSLHMAFVGNPGTGKTTVARIVAEIYGGLGILAKGHLVETDRSGLVAEYAGQTGPKTNAKIDEALDGVLFIDEAYTLIDESGQDQYGREAVQTLLKRMEDQRDRLVVILAGYPTEMQAMIRSNPGLSSRVGTTMHFADYGPEALCRIFELIAGKAKYTLPGQSRRRLLRGFTHLYSVRDRHFGNGRTSRNSFERSVRQLANRLAKITEVNRELLTTLQPEDIEVDGIDLGQLDSLAKPPGKIRIECTDCQSTAVIDDQLIGQRVACESCDAEILVEWGEPVTSFVSVTDQETTEN